MSKKLNELRWVKESYNWKGFNRIVENIAHRCDSDANKTTKKKGHGRHRNIKIPNEYVLGIRAAIEILGVDSNAVARLSGCDPNWVYKVSNYETRGYLIPKKSDCKYWEMIKNGELKRYPDESSDQYKTD